MQKRRVFELWAALESHECAGMKLLAAAARQALWPHTSTYVSIRPHASAYESLHEAPRRISSSSSLYICLCR